MFKKVNRIEHKRNKTEKPKKLNPWIPRIFNHQCYVTFLTGCYSCLWKFRQWEKTKVGFCCCTWKEQLFCPCLVISFVLSLMLLFLWIETSNEYFNFDWVTFLGRGYWFFWSIFILSLAGILTAYSSLLLLLGFLLLWEGIELYLHLCHKILVLLVILLCVILMFIICKFWKERWLVAGLSLQIFAPYVHLVSITVMVILFWPVAFYVAHLEREVRMRRYRMTHSEKKRLKKCNVITRLRGLQVAVGLPFLLILLSVYLMPLGIYSPCIQEKENLGPKPTIFGHRGAPMLGPENTMMSFEKAVEHGAHGLETDVHLSYDHVPFLMHDFDLRRTTNIGEVQPESAFENPAFFSWDFLSTLNAGKWFVKPELRPFYNMKPLSEADKERARNQSIPTLADLLTLAEKERKFVIFDLHRPPPKHPLRHTFIRQVVRVILASKIEQHLIFWLPTHDRQYVRSVAPGFQHVGRLVSVKTLAKNNISIINVDYKKLFPNGLRDYKAANIHINVYTVNEPWLFSLAWCSRINSVTTDNIGLLSQLNHPHFFMTPKFYMFMWLLADIISVLFIVAIFCFHWRRETKKEKLFETSSTRTDTQSGIENEEDLHIAMKPPARVVEGPWTLAALHPALPKSGKQHQGHFNVAAPSKKPLPIKNAVTPLKPGKHEIQSPMPTTIFELTQAPTRQATSEATFQTTLPTLKVDKPTMPSIEVPYP
ncbi:glycerophosphodiester phosphodiesterase domain-containing protein 4 isoform X1 [Pongo pygmaeus]|uniref:glycerophosphodiester phosphodiesterase domain-containing protein 4 isoform X1 n=1 Tax=Pongo abelii TaxID=9601 RepID=UPI0023E1B901|nr:glycerophosphodiester phosphodiesterase domain-containing protein 4 isoform X1 [Pongo abelii]XP_054293793.1 glycerophosphodiester phosphodiesterase domain-containing protein 4 isoform X1 [Pongo pygmaeus]XP_054382023.1 glycerophosphodiester phosphodiesterase domain-containing protein 4 isoform X1 [Pongo abelii]